MSIYVKDKNGKPVKVGAYTNIDNSYDKFWDEIQVNGNREYYRLAFQGDAWRYIGFNPKYKPIVIKGEKGIVDDIYRCANMFQNFGTAHSFGEYAADVTPVDIVINSELVDFSQAKDVRATFNNARIKEIDVDFSSATNVSSAFATSDGGNMPTIRLKITEACKTINNAFDYNYNIINLEFKEGSVIACNGLNVSWGNKLTHDSLMSIINALKDYSNDTSGTAWKVTFGATNLAKLTEAEKQIMTNKGWDYE